tara:strand:+ start:642 stop:812 length:171 start_codon:yes stop_codon:yes gene_type:complete
MMSKEMIDAIMDNDNIEAENAFKNTIAQKVGDALEVRRAELAGTFVKDGVGASEED